jgi:hypothetical protein
VLQPNHVETVVATLDTAGGPQLWKYSRYFDNPQFWTTPCQSDEVRAELGDPRSSCDTVTKTQPVPDQFELYNLTADPDEVTNLAFPAHRTPASEQARSVLAQILDDQRAQKRLSPTSGAAQGIPACTVS